MSQSAEVLTIGKPENGKDEHYSIASVLVKTIVSKGKNKTVTKKDKKIDEYHIDSVMELECLWHDPSGKWKKSLLKYSKSYNHSAGERSPKEGTPIVFTRTKDGGFTL